MLFANVIIISLRLAQAAVKHFTPLVTYIAFVAGKACWKRAGSASPAKVHTEIGAGESSTGGQPSSFCGGQSSVASAVTGLWPLHLSVALSICQG